MFWLLDLIRENLEKHSIKTVELKPVEKEPSETQMPRTNTYYGPPTSWKLGDNDGIYICRFSDTHYRVAWAPCIEDIQDIEEFNYVKKIPIPGTDKERDRQFSPNGFASIFFAESPTFDTVADALIWAKKLDEEYPGTQHGICVFAGVYETPSMSGVWKKEREEFHCVREKTKETNNSGEVALG